MHTVTTPVHTKTRKLTTLGGFAAIACVLMMTVRIPVVLFLSYEPKDVIIVIAGFIFGPLAVLALSLVVSFVEMLTISNTGPIGLLMNVISTCAFAYTASFIYKRRKTLSGAVMGLVCGVVLSTAAMMLWNYIIMPVYMGVPREAVVGMLLPVLLPFNLVKGGLNATLTLLLYKPLIKALRAARLIPESEAGPASTKAGRLGVYLVLGLVLISCVLAVLALQGII
ncbi:MAG: ECF transporter S component [Oscillospiraceae bacterium]|nr:ECF transporter S component [Oscillospiraceae bacterium]